MYQGFMMFAITSFMVKILFNGCFCIFRDYDLSRNGAADVPEVCQLKHHQL